MNRVTESRSDMGHRIKKFRKEHFLTFILVLYVVIVLAFATVNWALFMRNSTSFLISDQLNKHVERYEFVGPDIDLTVYHQNAKDNMPLTISGLSDMLMPEFQKLEATTDSLELKTRALERNIERRDALSKIAMEKRTDSIRIVRDRLLSSWLKSIDSLKAFMNGHDSTEMILEGKYVELANLQYEYAKRNVEVQKMITQNYGSFIPDSLAHIIKRCNDEYIGLSMELQELEMKRRDIVSEIRNLAVAYHKNRMESVCWRDFLYYSICVSTTVSFGDIAPNNGTTRLVAVLELLICLVLVGAIVDRIIKKAQA